MEPNSANLDALLKISQAGTDLSLNSSNNTLSKNADFDLSIHDDSAYTSIPEIFNRLAGIDMTMDNIADFQNIIFTAQDSLAMMQAQVNELKEIFEKTQKNEFTEEELPSAIKNINNKALKIQNLRDVATYNNINPFNEPISIEISNWQDVLGLHEKSERDAKAVAAEIMSSLGVTAENEQKNFTLGENNTLEIEYTDKNVMKITVNTAFMPEKFSLSEATLNDENTAEAINNFVSGIEKQQYNMEFATEFISRFFTESPTSDINNELQESEYNADTFSSKEVQEQIIQNAALTIANTTCITPGISTDML